MKKGGHVRAHAHPRTTSAEVPRCCACCAARPGGSGKPRTPLRAVISATQDSTATPPSRCKAGKHPGSQCALHAVGALPWDMWAGDRVSDRCPWWVSALLPGRRWQPKRLVSEDAAIREKKLTQPFRPSPLLRCPAVSAVRPPPSRTHEVSLARPEPARPRRDRLPEAGPHSDQSSRLGEPLEMVCAASSPGTLPGERNKRRQPSGTPMFASRRNRPFESYSDGSVNLLSAP